MSKASPRMNAENSINSILKVFVSRASQVVFGKEREIQLALTCILARGHLLIEDVPGVGKTTLVKTLAKLLDLPVTRVQFTNDMLPADLLGGRIYDAKTGEFRTVQGPIFSHIVLADELNRATPKTQSACLQAMEEGEVSIEGQVHKLPDPFFVIATQNPRTQVGTYALPESQIDRFLMRVELGYPTPPSEHRLIREGLQSRSSTEQVAKLDAVFDSASLRHHQVSIERVTISDALLGYVQRLALYTRAESPAGQGLSPRGAISLAKAARAWAYLEGRQMTLPEDVQAVGVAVMGHRLNPTEDPSGETGRRRAEDALAKVAVV
jgi:MoxR-like ATPase